MRNKVYPIYNYFDIIDSFQYDIISLPFPGRRRQDKNLLSLWTVSKNKNEKRETTGPENHLILCLLQEMSAQGAQVSRKVTKSLNVFYSKKNARRKKSVKSGRRELWKNVLTNGGTNTTDQVAGMRVIVKEAHP